MMIIMDRYESGVKTLGRQGRNQGDIKGFIPPSCQIGLSLTADAEYVASYRQHCAQRKPPVFSLLRGRF